MGMDFQYQGSASYPRFDSELTEVAAVFGGMLTDKLKEKRQQVEAEESKRISLDYWFGFMSRDQTDQPKFVFPPDTNETLVEWFNHPYDYFTPDQTATIWNCIRQHPEIEDISDQIYRELEMLAAYQEGWDIH